MLIRTERLTVTYLDADRPVLQNVDLQIAADERILLLGPSGAGKSTLLHALAGLVPRAIEAHVTGQVLLEDRPVTAWTPAQVASRLGFLFQEPETQFCMLYPADEVGFGLENLAVEPAAMPAIIAESFARVGLSEGAQQTRIDRLSGGQQQRLALASILAMNPSMLLLDEPTALLDPAGRRLVVETVHDLAQEGHGIIVVEHLLDPWLDLLERVILLDETGQIILDDTPEVLFSRHRSRLDTLGVWLPERVVSPVGKVPASPRQERSTPSASKSPVLTLSHLSASYGEGPPVLRDISLEVHPGQFWALVGANGSGKSSLAKTLIGMLAPSHGEVRLQDRPVSSLHTRELTEHIAYVFQNPEHQFVTDTVWSEILYSLRQAGVPEEARAGQVRKVLERFGLAEHAASNPFALSGGQKRRLAVAAMLQAGAPLLVLDEPTFGQDFRHAQELMQTISMLHDEGVAIFMLTHDMDLVDAYAERVAVLHDGRLVYAGEVAPLWSREEDLLRWDLELPRSAAAYQRRSSANWQGVETFVESD